MKYKNIIFGLSASMLFASEISAMQLAANRASKSMYRVNTIGPVMQKRKFNEAGEIVAGAMMILPLAYGMGQAAEIVYCITINALCEGSYRAYNATKYAINPKAFVTNTLYDQVTAIGSERCSTAYIKKEKCQNEVCCKNVCPQKKIEIFNNVDHKLYFFSTLKNGQQKLSRKEEQAKLLFSQNKIDTQGYQKIIGLIEHKKDCYDKQIALFDLANLE